MKLYSFYDKEADVLYFSKGRPKKNAVSRELDGDVIVRLRPNSKEVVGFTILNFSKRFAAQRELALPFEVRFSVPS